MACKLPVRLWQKLPTDENVKRVSGFHPYTFLARFICEDFGICFHLFVSQPCFHLVSRSPFLVFRSRFATHVRLRVIFSLVSSVPVGEVIRYARLRVFFSSVSRLLSFAKSFATHDFVCFCLVSHVSCCLRSHSLRTTSSSVSSSVLVSRSRSLRMHDFVCFSLVSLVSSRLRISFATHDFICCFFSRVQLQYIGFPPFRRHVETMQRRYSCVFISQSRFRPNPIFT